MSKSYALALECLRHIKNPKFSAIIIRRTFPQLTMPGGLLERTNDIYPYVGGKLKQGPPAQWLFRSGARIDLRYLQYDKNCLDYQGSELNLIAWDELTHFSEYQFFYMLSRNRSTSGIAPYIRASTNPDADSWVRHLIDWWLNEAGFPIPERSGVLRWFVRENGQMHWADSKQELCDRFTGSLPKSFTFVNAKITDNLALLEKDPGYLANLKALHPVDRARLLEGNWKVREEAGKFISRIWFEIVSDYPTEGVICRFWDLAGTEKQLKNDPDYTVGLKMLRSPSGLYYILDIIAVQISAAQVNQLLISTAHQDGAGCRVRWEIEPGSAGKINSATLTKLLNGFDAMGVRSQGDKMARAKGFATSAANEQIKLVRAAWNDSYLAELHSFPEGAHDDRIDASSGAYNELNKVRTKPQQPISFWSM